MVIPIDRNYVEALPEYRSLLRRIYGKVGE